MTAELPVVAMIAAYNEADVIGQVVGHLIRQGLLVYLLDDGSTDGTVAEAERFLGQGLLGIEALPPAAGASGEPARFRWTRILARKEALARELDAGWLIHHDADEFRESPWADVELLDAIRRVDALGYNAIDFELFDFRPTHDDFRPGGDVRAAFPYYEPGRPWDRAQVKCWKRGAAPVDLVSTGGHEALFPGRRVFPLRFVLRHYPVRGQAHGERKVFQERLPRFDPEERARAWHVQYDGIREGHRFVRDPAGLVRYDPVAARVQLSLRHRGVEALEAELAQARARAEALGGELAASTLEAGRLRAELAAVYASRSWRWMAPLRAAQRLLTGR